MSDQIKMGLRPKRRPKYRPSDEQDPENASYSRPNYVKMSVTSHSHQYISPSVLLNQNAKLLVKFITKANKNIRDVRLAKETSQKEMLKKDLVPKDKGTVEPIESNKKLSQSSKTPKTQPPKKNKQLYNFKGHYQNNSQLLKNLTQQQMLKGMKGIQISGLMNNKGIYSGPVSNQLSQLQSLQNLYPNLKDLNYQKLTQSSNPNLFQFNQQGQNPISQNTQSQQSSKQLGQLQSELGRNQKSKASESSIPKKLPQKNEKSDEKIFKRSAYHVAIAYHIYLKKLWDQGITTGEQVDPTYKARQIKAKAGLNNDEQ